MTATADYTLHDATPNGELIAPKLAESWTQRGLDAIERIYSAVGIRTYPVRWSSRLEVSV